MEGPGLYLLIAIFTVHFMLFFFDVLFKSCSHLPYLYFLENTGFQVHFLRLRWFTTVFNREFLHWGLWKPHVQAIWFSMGVVCSLCLMPVAAYLILHGLFSTGGKGHSEHASLELEPVVPGVNFPLDQLGNYMLALAVSGILHELGHALAAAREGVSILGCGAQLFLIVPIASVDLSTARLTALSTWRQLRVLCAGIWHNVVLALVSFLLLKSLAYTPVYALDQGITVTEVTLGSGISGPAGVKDGDHITGLDRCIVKSKADWQRCIFSIAHTPQSSYCAPLSFLGEHMVSKLDETCCGPDSPRHLCFHHDNDRWCLPARAVVEASGNVAPPCPDKSLPLVPDFGETSHNGTRLLTIQRSNGQRLAVLFLGHPLELLTTMQTSDWVSTLSIFPAWLPETVANGCSYITALSSGLALLNLLPCYGFDGQHITNLLVSFALSSCGVRSTSVSATVGAGFTAVGTGCLLAWLFTAIMKLVPAT